MPSTQRVVTRFLENPESQLSQEIETEITDQLRKFWKDVFNYKDGGDPPSLEDHFTVLDLAANAGRNIGPEYTPRKLRAIRRLSIQRIFQILDQEYRHSPAIARTLRHFCADGPNTAIVSTNWDIVVENHLGTLGIPYQYGLEVEEVDTLTRQAIGVPLLMLHGSANWIYCDSCRRLYVGHPSDGKAALRANIYLNADDFRILCPERKQIEERVRKVSREEKHCKHCDSRLSARIATFSYRKDVSIPQFQTVWQSAYSYLRDSTNWVFIGYSLPEADFEFRHLLKSAEKAGPKDTSKSIHVVCLNDEAAELRFKRFFGDALKAVCQAGLSGYQVPSDSAEV